MTPGAGTPRKPWSPRGARAVFPGGRDPPDALATGPALPAQAIAGKGKGGRIASRGNAVREEMRQDGAGHGGDLAETDPAEMDGLTLVLGSQRAGSSLLCRDLLGMGGLGAPEEYLVPLIRRSRRAKGALPGPEEILERIGRGRRADAPRIGALKLMVNQAQFLDRSLRRAGLASRADALDHVLDWARQRFPRLVVFTIRRANPLDQAVSRLLARETRTYHRRDGGAEDGTGETGGGETGAMTDGLAGLTLDDAFFWRVFREIAVISEETELLDAVAARNPDICHVVAYDDLAATPGRCREAIHAHATACGLRPARVDVTRELRKVVTGRDAGRLKDGFRAFAEARLAAWV